MGILSTMDRWGRSILLFAFVFIAGFGFWPALILLSGRVERAQLGFQFAQPRLGVLAGFRLFGRPRLGVLAGFRLFGRPRLGVLAGLRFFRGPCLGGFCQRL